MIVAAVPLKRLADAKSRLAPYVSARERQALVLRLARRTIDALRDSGTVSRVTLVTPETWLGDHLGVETLPDGGGLNASIELAVRWALAEGADALLVLPADLALLRPEDITQLVGGRRGRGIAIARTEDGGTGALLLSPPDVIPPAFGHESYARHVEAARSAKIPVREVALRGFAVDVDTVDDLDHAAL